MGVYPAVETVFVCVFFANEECLLLKGILVRKKIPRKMIQTSWKNTWGVRRHFTHKNKKKTLKWFPHTPSLNTKEKQKDISFSSFKHKIYPLF